MFRNQTKLFFSFTLFSLSQLLKSSSNTVKFLARYGKTLLYCNACKDPSLRRNALIYKQYSRMYFLSKKHSCTKTGIYDNDDCFKLFLFLKTLFKRPVTAYFLRSWAPQKLELGSSERVAVLVLTPISFSKQ